MLKVKGTVLVMAKAGTRLRREIERRADDGFRDAVREWVIAAARHTPKYTGTTMGTYVPLGRLVRLHIPPVSPVNDRAAKKKYFEHDGVRYKLGFEYAASPAQPYSRFNLKKNKGDLTNVTIYRGERTLSYEFLFEHLLLYVIWNNKFQAPSEFKLLKKTPWDTLDIARAFYLKRIAQLNRELRKLRTIGIRRNTVLAGSVKLSKMSF